MEAQRVRVASLAFVMVVSVFCGSIRATDHYVRSGASGAGSGADWTNAWGSFDGMDWTAINAGDTVYIGAGTYATLAVLKSGANGNPITFKRATVASHGAAAGWTSSYDGRVIIDGGGGLAAVGFGEGGDWMGKSFVTIDGATRYGIWLRNAMYGVRADRGPSCDNITLRNLEIGDAGAYKMGEDGIQGAGSNLLVESCYIHDNDSIVNHGDGMQWFHGNNLTLRYNVIKNCGQIFMLTEIWGGTSNDYVDNLNVYYNVFYNRSGTHYDGIKWKLAPRAGFAWHFYNNTFDLNAPLNPGDWEDRVMAGVASPNIDFRNNAVINSRYGSIGDNSHGFNAYDNAGIYAIPDLPAPLNETGGFGAADLGFVDSTNADYHLLAASPLIGKGAGVGLSQDFDGNPVPATPSIGAFERAATTVVPPSIATQPASKTVIAGQSVTFTVVATGGAPLSYQWQRNGTAISGASSASYTLSATKNTDNASAFRVIVSNSAGSVTSAGALLTVTDAVPVIASVSATPNPAAPGQSIAFSVEASDPDADALTYAWTFGDGTTATGSSVSHSYSSAGTFAAMVVVNDSFGGTVTSNLTVIVNAVSTSQTLLTTQRPVNVNNSDGASVNYELGMRFTADVSGQITAIRFFKASRENGAHTGHIWSAAGRLLATVSFVNETAGGWQEQTLAQPLTIAANTEYLVSVNTGNSFYVSDDTGFAAQIVNAHLRSIVGGNGRYGAPGKYPSQTWQSSNYFRDLRFTPNAANAATAASPTLTVTKVSAAMKFSGTAQTKVNVLKPGRDTVTVSGTLANASSGVNLSGQSFSINMGGAAADFTLDAHGRGKSSSGNVALKVKAYRGKGGAQSAGGDIVFTAKLVRGNFASSWGLNPGASVVTANYLVTVAVELGDNVYSVDASVKCTLKAGSGGALRK